MRHDDTDVTQPSQLAGLSVDPLGVPLGYKNTATASYIADLTLHCTRLTAERKKCLYTPWNVGTGLLTGFFDVLLNHSGVGLVAIYIIYTWGIPSINNPTHIKRPSMH